MAFNYTVLVPKRFDQLSNINLDDRVTRWAKAFVPGAPRAAKQHVILPNGVGYFLPGAANRAILEKGIFTFQIFVDAASYDALITEIEDFGGNIGMYGQFEGKAGSNNTGGSYTCDGYLVSLDHSPVELSELVTRATITCVFQQVTDWDQGNYVP